MDTINHLVIKFFLIAIGLLISHIACTQEFISIEHVGEEDSPIKGIIIVKTDNNYITTSGEFTEYGISQIGYEILKWYSINQRIKKNHRCGSIRKTHGAFEIRVYQDGDLNCFILKNPSKANDFIKGLIIESIET